MWRGKLEVNGLWTWNECVRHQRTRRLCLYLCGFLVQVCVWSYINLGMIVCELGCVRAHAHLAVPRCMHVYAARLSPAPSLGRRQSQCWGVYTGCSCGLSGQFRGRKALRSRPASLRVPSGRQRSPAIYIGFIPFPSTGPTPPPQRGSLNCTLPVP